MFNPLTPFSVPYVPFKTFFRAGFAGFQLFFWGFFNLNFISRLCFFLFLPCGMAGLSLETSCRLQGLSKVFGYSCFLCLFTLVNISCALTHSPSLSPITAVGRGRGRRRGSRRTTTNLKTTLLASSLCFRFLPFRFQFYFGKFSYTLYAFSRSFLLIVLNNNITS